MTTACLSDHSFQVPFRISQYVPPLVISSLFMVSLCPTALGNHEIPIPLSEAGFAASIEPRLSGTLKASNEAVTHHNLGLVLLSRQDIQAATEEFRTAIQLSSEFSDAYHGLGLCLMKSGDIPGAIQQYRQAIRLDPFYSLAHTNLGLVLELNGDTDAALEEYREAIRLRPDNPVAHNNLGILQVHR